MKKIIFLIVAILSLNVFAQDKIDEGVITIKMTMSSDNDQVNASLAMVGDMTMTTFFKGNKSRTEMNNPMAGNTTTVVDNDAKKMLLLMDNPMMGKKYSENDIKTSKQDLESLTVTKNGDTKTIAGYVCDGYEITGEKDGITIKMTMYTTDKIKAATQNNVTFGDKIKGFPMHLVTNVNQGGYPMKITMEVTDVKAENIEASKFDMAIPEGYSKMEKPKPATID